MAKVVLICLYDHRALGLRIISNLLQASGHQVNILHFKLPVTGYSQEYLENPTHYEAIHSSDMADGFSIRNYNYDVSPWTSEDLHLLDHALKESEPQIIGISTRSAYQRFLPELSRVLRSQPKAITIAGGFGATFDQTCHAALFDYVCVGEGEQVMLQVAEAVDAGRPLHGIANLVRLQKDGRLLKTPLMPPLGEDNLYNFAMSSVSHQVIENGQLFSADILLRQVKIPHSDAASYHTMAGLGCLNQCSYCCAGRMVELYKDVKRMPKRRMRPIENVIEELRFARGYGFPSVTFLDSFFVASRRYLLEFFEAYRRDVGLPFFCQFYPQQVLSHPELLDSAMEAGLNFTVIGIQSGSDRINREIFNRPMPNKQAVALGKMLEDRAIPFQYHIITHNPFVDESAHRETLDLIRNLPKKGSELVLLRLRPFPGTEIAERIASMFSSNMQDTNYMNKQAVLYLLRFHMNDEAFEGVNRQFDRLDFAELRSIFIQKVIEGGLIRYEEALRPTKHLDIDTLQYKARRGLFGTEYSKALDQWISVPTIRNLNRLDECYLDSAWQYVKPAAEDIDINLTGLLYGIGWGVAESNIHGQHWRWIGPTSHSSLLLCLRPGKDYRLKTLIHTARGDSLFNLKVQVNGVWAFDQGIVRDGERFYHQCTLPASSIKEDPRIIIQFIIDGGHVGDPAEEGRVIALTSARLARM